MVEGFMVNLKTFLSMAMPNQYTTAYRYHKVNIKLVLG